MAHRGFAEASGAGDPLGERTVSSAYLRSAYSACVSNGCPAGPLNDLIDGAPHSLDNPSARFPCQVLNDCLFLAEELTGQIGMGILFGQNIRPSSLMDIGYALLSCDTLADMIAFNGKYQRLTQQLARGYLEPKGRKTHLVWEPYDTDPQTQRPSTEGTMAGYAGFGRWVTWDPEIQIEEMHFRHAEPSDISLYRKHFPWKLVFGAEQNMLVAPTDLFLRPLPQANPGLVAILAERLDRALAALDEPLTIRRETFLCVQSMLRDGAPSIVQVAKTLGMTERTLRRRLDAENTSFRAVLEEARRDACELYLKEGKRGAADIALLLGYSEQSAYSRAFKSWYGVPPSQHRMS